MYTIGFALYFRLRGFAAIRYFAAVLLALLIFAQSSSGQAEVAPWGNIRGIRVGGELMAFESSLNVAAPDWSKVSSTALEHQRPQYAREGDAQLVTTHLDSVYFTEKVEDIGSGQVRVEIGFSAHADTRMEGAYFSVALPWEDYGEGTVQLIDPAGSMPLGAAAVGNGTEYIRYPAHGVRFVGAHRQLEIDFDEPDLVIVRKDSVKGVPVIRLYLPVHTGDLLSGASGRKLFTVKASGDIDKAPIHLALNTSESGPVFDGFGGNFRLQNPKMDPQVIDYCLQNMRVAWGRVELPWAFWQPVRDSNPMDSAKAGVLNPRVYKAMEMAQRLGKMNIPFILSGWFPPKWAVEGEIVFGPRPNGVRGNPLDQSNIEAIYKSITDYILYLKKEYGVEPRLFSFNESDMGINVRQTGEEHDALIKGLGAWFAAHGVKTKMLLGDNSDANSYTFIDPAMADPAALAFMGAVSFHSWRGWATETLQKWRDAALKTGLPLIVAEGSIDAAASRYPAIFQEQTYALQEINLYVRILSICKPLTILQWQLTSDYSPLVGGGMLGDTGALRPTQRFWNLKQLASTPKDLHFMPITSDRPDVSCAALGNSAKNRYSIQLVNNSAAREVTLSGLPKKLRWLRIVVTDKDRAMKEGSRIPVSNGEAKFTLDATSYTTLSTD